MVVCPEPLAAEAGAEILRRGGNAADAAVAAAFAQGVVDPLMCGIGGVATIIAHSAERGFTIAIQAKGVAGSLARPDIYLADVLKGQYVPIGETVRVRGDRNCMGYESVIVPGFVRGMAELIAWCGSGRVDWAEMLGPAAQLAHDGFEVDPYIDRFWAPEEPYLTDVPPAAVRLAATEASASIYLREGNPYRTGERLIQRDYARTLRRLAAAGPDDYYGGEIARTIADDFAANGGLFTADDLRRYRPLVGAPIRGTFHDLSIASVPPPAGGVLMILILNMLEGVDVRALGWNTPRYLDALTRIFRDAFAEFRDHVGDPRFTPVPVEMLTSKSYAAHVEGRGPRAFAAREGTTTVSVMDGEGSAVCITHTNRDASGVVTPGLGFLFNNDMGSFDPVPGGLDSIVSGKMPRAAGPPMLLLKDGQVWMVIGSPAGTRMVTASIQALLNVRFFGMTIGEAVAAERIHVDRDAIVVEPSFPENVAEGLRGMGHTIACSGYTARLAAIVRDRAGGRLEGGSDPRGGGGLVYAAY